ncbi:MAG TPA: TetR/AcrR family transcriptional regulator [Solirubrobacteraceae bacterium]|nr:TetR/AcrR family transcriptional regulator [Solirubrobacteraceae bacterium]
MPRGRTYGGKTTEERRAERRAQLLEAGLQLFGTAGYLATTIEELCSTAGLNPRYFYEQFESREALLQAVYDRHVQQVLAHVLKVVEDTPAEPRARLHAGLRAFVDATLADERGARVNYFEIVGVNRELEAHRRGVLRGYAELIAAQAEALGAPASLAAGDRRLAATALVGATDGLVIAWLSGEHDEPHERLVNTLLHIFAPL